MTLSFVFKINFESKSYKIKKVTYKIKWDKFSKNKSIMVIKYSKLENYFKILLKIVQSFKIFNQKTNLISIYLCMSNILN